MRVLTSTERLRPRAPEIRGELVAQSLLERADECGAEFPEMIVLNAIGRVALTQLLEHWNELVRDIEPVHHKVEHGHELVDLIIHGPGRKHRTQTRVDLEQAAVEDGAHQGTVGSE